MSAAGPIAVLADIHGNRWALEAVLEDARGRGIREWVSLGDCLYGPLDPAGTADRLMALDMPAVRGNEDRILLDDPARHPESPSLAFCRSELAPAHLRWLAALPFSAVHEAGLFLCHASPQADDAYLLWEVESSGARRRPPTAVAGRLAGIAQPVVLCGHDHLPARLDLPGGRILIDPGSVGLPAFRDDHPFPHAMEAGSPHARYAVLRRSPAGWAAEFVAVSYDHESAAKAAQRNGRPDWAHALRTGLAAGPGSGLGS